MLCRKAQQGQGVRSGAGGMQFQREGSGISLSDKVLSESERQRAKENEGLAVVEGKAKGLQSAAWDPRF